MGLMSNLWVGKSGLSMSQYSINTTAHNLANVDTPGFVRQQMILGTASYLTVGQNAISKMQTGLGVNAEEVKQVRDIFLDKAYRQEIGRESFYRTQYEAVEEMENVFGEVEGVAFQNSLKDFWVSLQELAKEPESIVTRASLVQTAVSFTERAENIYNQIRKYQVNLNEQIESKVARINEIGDTIAELNKKICQNEGNGIENANDLRDQRNLLLDELGEYVNVTYREGMNGQVSVLVEQMPFVTEGTVFHMSTTPQVELLTKQLTKEYGGDEEAFEKAKSEAERICNSTNMLVPTWPIYGDREVFNFDRIPEAKNNTDIGGLKGLILARGTRVGKYSDLPIKPSEADFTEDDYFDEDAYKLAMANYQLEVDKYNSQIEPSVIMTVQAQFDQLVHGIVTTINDILCPNKEYVLGESVTITKRDGSTVTYNAGDTVRIFDKENAPIGMDEKNTAGTELFSRKSTPRYETVTLADGTELMIYNEEDPLDNYTMYTLGEIEINENILEDKSMLPLNKNDKTGEFDIKTAEELLNKWQEKFAALSPNNYTVYNFDSYYTAFIAELANRGDTLITAAEKQDMLVQSIENKRLSTTAVSSDEELTNLIRYQHAYNAAARYMNVVDEMLEHVVSNM